jgi:hypothetical protein
MDQIKLKELNMELLSIENINQKYLHYDRLRSVRSWLSRQGISIIKLGKRFYVDKSVFEEVLKHITERPQIIQQYNQNKLQGLEKKIYDDLLDKL